MFWQFIKKCYLDNGSSDTSVICNWFADYFKSVYSNSDSFPLSDLSSLNPIFIISTLNLSLSDVESALLPTDDNISIDIDGMANLFIKSYHLEHFYKVQLKSSTTFQIARFLGAPHSGSTPYPDPGTKSNKKQQAEIRACKKRYTASFAIYCAVMQKIAARCTDLNASSSTKEEKKRVGIQAFMYLHVSWKFLVATTYGGRRFGIFSKLSIATIPD